MLYCNDDPIHQVEGETSYTTLILQARGTKRKEQK